MGKIVKPFLKWAGGKRQIIHEIEKYLPDSFNNYFEPFLGGGALFFHLTSQNSLFEKQVVLSDYNSELINLYKVIKYEVDQLIEELEKHFNSHSEGYYYQVRNLDRVDSTISYALSNVEKAARMIYLNRTCFNGLYRLNKKGQFNVPIGKSINLNLVNYFENLKSVRIALSDVDLYCKDFGQIIYYAEKNDFIYFDPPYLNYDDKQSFSYISSGFNLKDHERLSELFNKLNNLGCFCMMSNSDIPVICDLYKNMSIHKIKAKRMINVDMTKRGFVNEVIITNY